MATTILDGELGPRSQTPGLDFYYRQFFADPLLQGFYADSGFGNLGYWDETTRDAGEAGNRLIDELLALIPELPTRVLDVACGQGGSALRLSQRIGAGAVTAIGHSQEQIAAASARAPGCRFLVMDATQLSFPEASFDAVICVEAAFHFDTRERFFREAFRVLAPGGWLLLSDLCMAQGTLLVPAENHLAGPSEYAALLERCGFRQPQVRDVMRQTWSAFRRRFTDYVLESRSRYATPFGLRALLAANTTCAWAIRSSLLAAARKPEA